MRRGKSLQIGAGSRRRSQARAEDAARRSRKRADTFVARMQSDAAYREWAEDEAFAARQRGEDGW